MGASRRLAVNGASDDEDPGSVHDDVEGFASVCSGVPVGCDAPANVCGSEVDDPASFNSLSFAALEAAIRRCLNPNVLKSPAAGSMPAGSTGIFDDLFFGGIAKGGQEPFEFNPKSYVLQEIKSQTVNETQ